MKKINNLRSLLVTPHSKEYHSIRELLADALRKSGVEPILLEETVAAGMSVYNSVPEAIQRADFIIVDFTGNNPSVMYEVGFAHAMRKPILYIVQQGVEHIPSEIEGNLFFVYDPSKPEELRRYVQIWAEGYLSRPGVN